MVFFRDETIGRGYERGEAILDDDMQDMNDEKQISEQVLSIFYEQNNKSSVVQVLYL